MISLYFIYLFCGFLATLTFFSIFKPNFDMMGDVLEDEDYEEMGLDPDEKETSLKVIFWVLVIILLVVWPLLPVLIKN